MEKGERDLSRMPERVGNRGTRRRRCWNHGAQQAEDQGNRHTYWNAPQRHCETLDVHDNLVRQCLGCQVGKGHAEKSAQDSNDRGLAHDHRQYRRRTETKRL